MIKNKIISPFFISTLVIMALVNHFSAIGTGYFMAVILFWFLIVLWGFFVVFSNYHVKVLCGNPKEKEKIIALTFDDGPN